jgi:exopolysaccharide biosynthesis polyprenyl glycosylphosphotransferase
MTGLNKQESLVLLVGDIFIFAASLWLTLFIRYGQTPDLPLLKDHMIAFAPILIIWFVVFFIAGLYDRHTMILRSRLPGRVLKAQAINGIVAVAFFYFASYLKIAPKTVLFVYVLISSLGAILWRVYGYPLLGSRSKQNALLIGEVEELRELEAEVNHNDFYPMRFVSAIDFDDINSLDLDKDLIEKIYSDNVTVIAVDTNNEKISPLLPHLYNLTFSNIRFINLHKLYEEIFKRVPLSLVKYSWFLENISSRNKPAFDAVKRFMDLFISIVVGLVSLPIYPFVILAIKIDDGGPIFSIQERVGQNNRIIKLYKFRTMDRANDGGKWNQNNENKITRIGALLRKTRIDELPQLWNVFRGEISLIGPRPEFPEPVKLYEKQVPYYRVRHLVKPGLSGWAQIHHENDPHHQVDITETKNKLSYDLYYINNRSYLLDMEIALKTIRILLSFQGK